MERLFTDAGETSNYYAYLLRLWREGQAGESWRASLQSAATGQRMNFASLEDLFNFLQRQTGAAVDEPVARRDQEEVMG
jgi:hypothetical protein